MLSLDGNENMSERVAIHMNESIPLQHKDIMVHKKNAYPIADGFKDLLSLPNDKSVFKYIVNKLNEVSDDNISLTLSNTINFILYNFYYFHMVRSSNNQCEYCLNNTQYLKIYDLVNVNNVITSNDFLFNAFSVIKEHHDTNENVTNSNILLDYYYHNELLNSGNKLNPTMYYNNDIKSVDDLYMYKNENNFLKHKKNKKSKTDIIIEKEKKLKNSTETNNDKNVPEKKKYNVPSSVVKQLNLNNKKEDYNIDFIGYHGFLESDYQRQLLYNDFEYYVDFYHAEKERSKSQRNN